MARTKTFEGRTTRWGPGRVHLYSGERTIIEEPVGVCGTIGTLGNAAVGRRKDVTCKRCLKKMRRVL